MEHLEVAIFRAIFEENYEYARQLLAELTVAEANVLRYTCAQVISLIDCGEFL
jgi:hypothetical protein